jgi:hypothetical protein
VLAENLKLMMGALQSWSRANFGNVTKQIAELKAQLGFLEQSDPVGNRDSIRNTKFQLDELLYREEMMWLQRSQITWLKGR